MMLRDAFPQTEAAFPLLADWQADFNWVANDGVAAVYHFVGAQANAAQRGYAEVILLSELLRADVKAAMATASDEPTHAAIDCMRFMIALLPMDVTMRQGVYGDCYGWTLGAISRTHNPDARINRADYVLPPFVGASEAMNRVALDHLLWWITTAFMLARKFGGFDALAGDVFDYCMNHCLVQIARGADVDGAIEALVAMANWATKAAHPRAKPLTHTLLNLYDTRALQARTAVRIGFVLVTAAGYWTRQTPQAWARQILTEQRPYLIEHEIVQLLAVAVDTRVEWEARRNEVLEETRRLADYYRAIEERGSFATLALESRVSILHPLFFNLATFGTTDDLMDLLWAWYGRDEWTRGDANILFVGPAHGDGVAYVWPGGRWIADPVVGGDSLDEVLQAVSAALNDYYRGPAGDRQILFDERLAGAPAREHGPMLEQRVMEHYRLDLVRDQLPAEFRPRSMVILPAHQDPIQAMLAQCLSFLIPHDATLAQPAAPRPIRTISVWPGETFQTDAEVQVIRAVARREGWMIKLADQPLDKDAFQRYYEDAEADVLWVIGHGEQSPYDVDKTGLVLGDGSILPMRSIAALRVPTPSRRLLILNICSSGATQTLGGLARIGLAQELVAPNQAVIAHQWPIDLYAALAFGSALARKLADQDLVPATAAAIALLRNQAGLLAELAAIDPDLEAIRRLSGEQVEAHINNVLSWGCPILLT